MLIDLLRQGVVTLQDNHCYTLRSGPAEVVEQPASWWEKKLQAYENDKGPMSHVDDLDDEDDTDFYGRHWGAY